jgi:predicted metal-dependent phosphoesterase TrpH
VSLETFSAPGHFYRGNIHTHSTGSDGDLSPEEVCHRYQRYGYDFLCITDHFKAEFGYPITDTEACRSERFTTISGAELHAPAIWNDELWHILAVGLPRDFPPPANGETGPELARRARDAGAFVAIPHPEWYGLGLEDGLALDAAHAVEVYNHIAAQYDQRGGGSYFLDMLLNAGMRVNALAVDDAHFKTLGHENRDAFGGWVMVRAEANEPDALLAALKAGRYYSSCGPVIRKMAIENGQLAVETSPARMIALLGPGSRTAKVFDTNSALLPLEKFAGSWARLVVLGDDGKPAWSNPVWL